MPLEKSASKEAFNHNVSAEVQAGKPIKQAVAIAYSTKRHSDIMPSTVYKENIQSYGLSSLKNANGAVTSPQEARQIASNRSGQSENIGLSNYSKEQQSRKSADRFGVRKK